MKKKYCISFYLLILFQMLMSVMKCEVADTPLRVVMNKRTGNSYGATSKPDLDKGGKIHG